MKKQGTNPDLYRPFDVPEALRPYVRRALIADTNEPVEMEIDVRATGYHYLGWVWRGCWQGDVNGQTTFDSDTDGPLAFTGQVKNNVATARLQRDVGQIWLEFTALGHFQLLGIHGSPKVSVPQVLNPSLRPHLEELFQAEDLDATKRVTLIADVLNRLPKHPVPHKMVAAVEQIEKSDGDIRIAELVSELGLAERQFRSDFEKLIGLTPKAFCKTLQINHALNQLLINNGGDLAGIAAQSGFSDQSHFTRAFGDFLGKTPGNYLEDIEATLLRFVGQSRR